MLEAMVGGFDEDLRFVSGSPKDAPDAEHFVADRVAIAKRREHLMDADHARFRSSSRSRPTAGPFGNRARTSSAGGQVRWRRSNQPGNASQSRSCGSFDKRPSMSRYFPSSTGQS